MRRRLRDIGARMLIAVILAEGQVCVAQGPLSASQPAGHEGAKSRFTGAPTPARPFTNPAADPLPVLRNVRWQYLTVSGGGFCVDARGRAWFPRTDAKPFGVYCAETGEFVALVPSGRGPVWVMLDGAGRFWFATEESLCWRDPATAQVHQRPPSADAVLKVEGFQEPFFRRVLEHSSGRLYFADHAGIHVFDNGEWAFQQMAEPGWQPGSNKLSPFILTGVYAVEGADGRVIVWTTSGASNGPSDYYNGLWVHEGKSWTQFSMVQDERLRDIQAVIPLRGDLVLVSTRYKPAFVLDLGPHWPLPPMQEMLTHLTKLGDVAEPVRAQARKAVLAMGPRARAKLSDAARLIADKQTRALALAVIGEIQVPGEAGHPPVADVTLVSLNFLCRSAAGDFVISHGPRDQSLAAIRPDGRIVFAPKEIPTILPLQLSDVTTANASRVWDGRVMISTNPFTVWDGQAFRTTLNEPFAPGGISIGGQDAQGRIYLGSPGDMLVFDGRYEDARPRLPFQAFPAAAGKNMQSAALDSTGRLWVRLDPRQHPFLSCYTRGNWTHLGDPGPPRILHETVQDAGGQRIVRRTFKDGKWTQVELPPGPPPAREQDVPLDPDIIYHSCRWYRRAGMVPMGGGFYFREDPDKRLPALANPLLLQPLKNGALVAADWSGRAYFFDGKEWFVYARLAELVWAHHAKLVELIDNDRGRGLGLDATGRIWAGLGMSRDDWGFVAGPDGWTKVKDEFRRFTRDGRRCLTYAGVLDTTVFPAVTAAALEPRLPSYAIHRAVFDGQGRAWFLGPSDSWKLDNGQLFRLPNDPHGWSAVFADFSGRVWFHPPFPRGDELCMLCPDGRWLTVKAPGPWVGQILEQSKDTFWSIRGRRFSRLRLTDEPGKAGEAGPAGNAAQTRQPGQENITLDREYTGCVPEEISWTGIDPDGALWVLTSGREGIIRYELPKP